LVRRRTYIDGKFRGKFAGKIDLQKSDLSHENFYDLEFLDGDLNTKKSNVRHWTDGESKKFARIKPFPTSLINPLKCCVAYPDGTFKHFAIDLCEPKIRKPILINQVYEENRVFTTIDGEISGYITHVELAGAVVELPEPELEPEPEPKTVPIAVPVSIQDKPKAPDTAPDRTWTTHTAGSPGRFSGSGGVAGSGCFNPSGKGCFTGCGGVLLALFFGVVLIWSINAFLVVFWRKPVPPALPTEVNSNREVINDNSPPPTPPVQMSNSNNEPPSDDGRFGRLTTNQHLRSSPGLFAPSVAIQFQNARFRILESEPSSDGTSTWYKVEIVEYGCDAERLLGCGKSTPTDSDTGWLNGKYVEFE